MNKHILFILIISLIFSCKKDDEIPPIENTQPIISTSEITDIMQTSAICGGFDIEDGGTAILSKGVCWSTITNPTIDGSFTNDGAGIDNFTSNLINLEDDTTYYIRAYATNSEGTAYGNEQSFSTLSYIYEGDVVLEHQQEVVDFGALGYTEINGNLEIYGGPDSSYPDRINDLSPLESLKKLMATIG